MDGECDSLAFRGCTLNGKYKVRRPHLFIGTYRYKLANHGSMIWVKTTLPDMAAVARCVDDGDRVRLQLLLDLPRTNNNNNKKKRKREHHIASTRCAAKIRSKKRHEEEVEDTLVSSACMAGESVDPAGPGADAQAANPLLLAPPEGGGGDQAANLVVVVVVEERATAA